MCDILCRRFIFRIEVTFIMLFLLLAMLSSAVIAVIMRFGSQRVQSKLGLISMNYIVCSLLSAAYTLPQGGLLPVHTGLTTCLWLGAICGVLYLLSFVLLQWNTVKNGVVLSSVFMKLGVLVPTAMSVLFFHETPGLTQIIGFVLAIAAILLMNMEKGASGPQNGLALIALLVFGGMSDAMSKVYEQLGSPQLENQFLLYTFVVAMLLCIVLMLSKGQRMGKWECLYGAVLGIPNFFSAKFLLQSLNTVPAVVAFPTFSVGTIVLVSLCGVTVFKEKLSRQQIMGILVILAALVLLNI